VRVTATRLRGELYRILDQILETGEPVEIDRKGKVLRIVPAAERSRLDRLEPHAGYIVGDPDELVHLDWSSEWKP
jgi:antitoxin (DNA-binding transcriptional repressor) of toxin-antitoxin stability system